MYKIKQVTFAALITGLVTVPSVSLANNLKVSPQELTVWPGQTVDVVFDVLSGNVLNCNLPHLKGRPVGGVLNEHQPTDAGNCFTKTRKVSYCINPKWFVPGHSYTLDGYWSFDNGVPSTINPQIKFDIVEKKANTTEPNCIPFSDR